MASETTDPIRTLDAKRRVALVVSILKGETSVAEAARTYGLTMAVRTRVFGSCGFLTNIADKLYYAFSLFGSYAWV